MREKTKNIVSAALPIITLIIISVMFRMQPTGLAAYDSRTLFRVNGSISLTLEDAIPSGSYLEISMGSYRINVSMMDFVRMSGKPYTTLREDSSLLLSLNDTYRAGLAPLGFAHGFEKGNYTLEVRLVHEGSVLHKSEQIVEI